MKQWEIMGWTHGRGKHSGQIENLELAGRERDKDRGPHMSKQILRLEFLFIFMVVEIYFTQTQWQLLPP